MNIKTERLMITEFEGIGTYQDEGRTICRFTYCIS